jgi:hypothetical protein
MSEDKIIEKLIEHDEQLEKIEAKLDNLPTKGEWLQKQDEMISILKRLNQKRVFTTEALRRIELVVEEHTKEIRQIKQHLKLI